MLGRKAVNQSLYGYMKIICKQGNKHVFKIRLDLFRHYNEWKLIIFHLIPNFSFIPKI